MNDVLVKKVARTHNHLATRVLVISRKPDELNGGGNGIDIDPMCLGHQCRMAMEM